MKQLIRFSFVFGIASVVCLVAGFTTVVLTQTFDAQVMSWLIASVLAFSAYAWLDAARINRAVQSRAFLYGSGSSLMVALAVIIASLAFVLADRYDKSWDLTRDRKYTLSEQTVGVLAALDEPVKVTAFFRDGTAARKDFEQLLKRAQNHTNNLEVTFYDPLRNPLIAERYEIESETAVIFELGEEKRTLDHDFDEKGLTRELVLLRSDADHEICWSLGHGEPDPDDVHDPRGLGGIVSQLEHLNYQVLKQFVLTEGIRRDCEALVIARPLIDWFPYELEALAAYLAEGGRVLLLLEPMEMGESLPEELERYGLRTRPDVVVDVDPKNLLMGVQDPSSVVLSDENLLSHPITRGLSAAVVLGIARSVEPMDAVDGLSFRRLLETSENAWGETHIENLPNIEPDPNELAGPVPVMVAVEIQDPAVLEVAPPDPGVTPDFEAEVAARVTEVVSFALGREADQIQSASRLREDLGAGDADLVNIAAGVHTLFGLDLLEQRDPLSLRTVQDVVEAVAYDLSQNNEDGALGRGVPADFTPREGGRLVVVGDSDFASNRYLAWGNNQDLFLNSLAWLVEEEDQLGERPAEGDKLELTYVSEMLLCLISLIFLPGGTLAFAALVMLRRRYL